jgi:trimeric autotransporter adhesin
MLAQQPRRPTVCCTAVALAQPAAKTTTAVPRLVNFSGTLTDGAGKAQSGVVGVTLLCMKSRRAALRSGWKPKTCRRNVQAAANGDYTALLGSTRNEGIPAEAFGSGERWLGIQAQGETERPRVLMTSVPYSLKAVDAETLGGLPASAFALATRNGAGLTPRPPSP